MFAPYRLAAGLLAVAALAFAIASYRLGFWMHGEPGPGLLPFVAAVLLIPSAVVIALGRPTADDDPALSRRVFGAILLFTLYGISLPWGGFVLPSIVMCVAWMRLLHDRPLGVSLLVGIGLTAAASVLFGVLLKVPLELWPGAS